MKSAHTVFLKVVCLICISLDSFYQALPLTNNVANHKKFLDLQAADENSDIYTNKGSDKNMRMFPKHFAFTHDNKKSMHTTKNFLQLWANPEGKGRPPPPTKDHKDGSAAQTTRSHGTELTISLPIFKTDQMGNWVFNPWAVTFGDLWMDTRFHKLDKPDIPRITVDHFAPYNYYPKWNDMSTVCQGRSTVYNKEHVDNWLTNLLSNASYANRPIWLSLRKEIYQLGNSEECHTIQNVNWRKYQECALMRNMRMESLIPKYPLYQAGYTDVNQN